jgi:hypothetical protein
LTEVGYKRCVFFILTAGLTVGFPLSLASPHSLVHPSSCSRLRSAAARERLLSDAMAGDGTLFAGQDGVEAAWAVIQPVLGLVTPVHDYQPGTWGPSEAENLSVGICGCDSPVWLLPNSIDGAPR